MKKILSAVVATLFLAAASADAQGAPSGGTTEQPSGAAAAPAAPAPAPEEADGGMAKPKKKTKKAAKKHKGHMMDGGAMGADGGM